MAQSYHFNREVTNNYKGRPIQTNGFFGWQKDHMYKSSYAKFHSNSSVEPKNTAIPGYGGFVPGIKAENIHAKGFANIAKQSFNNQKLGKNILGLATTGFNVNKDAFIDHSKNATSSKFGKSALQRPHPNWSSAQWVSTTQDFYKNPNQRLNPTYRSTDKFLQNTKQTAKNSGFGVNHSYFDGKGWKPDPILKGDINRTEYRDRFNQQQNFHRNTFVDKIRKLPENEMNYKYN